MFFSRFAFISLIAAASATLAAPAPAIAGTGALARRAPSPNVANWAAPLDRKRDFDASDETELMRRAIDGL
ncbi:hypothetical protein JCM11641_004081, partial [Rhodosporidiobolus odoratus]